MAALLHDIGKVTTTRLEDGALVSPRHGPVGAKLARRLLWQDLGLCGEADAQRFREAVCLLVKYHTKPPHLFEGDGASRAMLKLAANGELAPDFTLNALCLLAQADVPGRVASDNPDFLDRIELARELALEEGCLNDCHRCSACAYRFVSIVLILYGEGDDPRGADLFPVV